MNSPRCTAAQNGCQPQKSEIMRLLNSINNTPISECCDDRANRRMDFCDAASLPAPSRAVDGGVEMPVAPRKRVDELLAAGRLGYVCSRRGAQCCTAWPVGTCRVPRGSTIRPG